MGMKVLMLVHPALHLPSHLPSAAAFYMMKNVYDSAPLHSTSNKKTVRIKTYNLILKSCYICGINHEDLEKIA